MMDTFTLEKLQIIAARAMQEGWALSFNSCSNKSEKRGGKKKVTKLFHHCTQFLAHIISLLSLTLLISSELPRQRFEALQ